jgi:hypothetical protein
MRLLQMVPYFNAPIYLDKNSKIGKVDEVRNIKEGRGLAAVAAVVGA